MIINVCFHGVGVLDAEREPGEARYWITEDFFYSVLDEVVRHPHVRLSFDDGNKSDVLTALPALQERGLCATFFPLAGRLMDPASLDEGDLRFLRSAGMQIGSHGWEHIPWRQLNDEQAHRELLDARRVLSDASSGPIEKAALPLGRYDRAVLERLKKAGYATVYTSDRMPARESSWLQARYSVTATDTIENVRMIIGARSRLRDSRNLVASWVKRIR